MSTELDEPNDPQSFVLVLLGPPGSGKGTQGKRLAKELGAIHLSSGDLVKELANRVDDSQLTREIKERFERGIPQPDEIIIKLVRHKVTEMDYKKGIIFDAFPLSVGQADGLSALVTDLALPEPLVIYFDLSMEESVRRLTNRKFCPVDNLSFKPGDPAFDAGICDKCQGELVRRADDTPEIARHRYAAYDKRNGLIKDYYQKKGRLVVIDASRSIEEVYRAILEVIE